MSKKTEKKQRGKGKPFTKDDPRINRKGRPKGTKNFSTLFEEAVKKIAEDKGIKDVEQIKVDLVIRAVAEARDGNYKFWKDLFDRLYGKAPSSVDITSKGDKIDLINLFQQGLHDESGEDNK